MRGLYHLFRLLRLERDLDARQPVPGSRSPSWGVSTWLMAIGTAAGVVGLMADRRLLLPGSVLLIAGLVVAVAGSVMDVRRDK